MKHNNDKKSYQDLYLNYLAEKEISVTIFLVSGFQIRGTINASDNFTVVIHSEGKQNMVYKHAISTIVPSKPVPVKELFI